jgi:hypothetical protein
MLRQCERDAGRAAQPCSFSESDPRVQHRAFAVSPVSDPRGAASAVARDFGQRAARALACPTRAQLGTQLRLGAAPCGFLAGFLSVFGLSMHVANVGVAGSSPVSCSSFRRPAQGLLGRGDALAGHVATWGSCGRKRPPIATASRGCAGGRSGFDEMLALRARACLLRNQAAGSPVAFPVPLHAPKQRRRASRDPSPPAPADRRSAAARGTPRPARARGRPSPSCGGCSERARILEAFG